MRRSKLITPALRPDLLPKAARSGADVVHVELEDGVPLDRKAEAREAAAAAVDEIDWGRTEVWVRINAPGTAEAAADVEAVVPKRPAALLIPKVNGPQDVREVAGLVTAAERAAGLPAGLVGLAVVVERIRALAAVEELATADPRVTAIVLGTDDMGVELGYRLDRTGPSWETLYLKSRCILAARLAGIDCIDAAHFYYRDEDGTRRAAEWSAQLGFTGKTCLSPRQVPIVNRAFSPTEEEVAWASSVIAVLDAAAEHRLSVAVADGMMVDAPHAAQARAILERARAAGDAT
jgi:citrate lyase beta subunit